MDRQDFAGRSRSAHHVTGARLAFAVLGYLVAVIAVITLLPFRFAVPDRFGIVMHGTLFDVAANVLLFLPPGFLYRLARPSTRDRAGLHVLVLGVAASLLIEAVQLFEPARYASPLDVVANGLGAWTGALLSDRVARRIRPDSVMVGRLSLEIPLMGLTYMLVPLLWLASLSAVDDAARLSLLLLPALFGATIIAFVHRYRLGRPGRIRPHHAATGAALGMLAAIAPAAPRQPVVVLLLVVTVGLFVMIVSRIPAGDLDGDRRFERRALRAALPFFVCYLVALPWLSRVHAAGASPAAMIVDRLEILRLLELLAAFTVLGWVIAEWRGRLDLPATAALPPVMIRTLPIAGLAMGLRFMGGPATVLIAALGAAMIAASWGAGLYYLQRAHVRALIDTTSSFAEPAVVRQRRPAA